MYYEVKAFLKVEEGDFPFMEIDYFDNEEEAIAHFNYNKKNKNVLYANVEKITKSTKKTIRSYEK